MFSKQMIMKRKMSSLWLLAFLFVLSSGGCGRNGVTFIAGSSQITEGEDEEETAADRLLPSSDDSRTEESMADDAPADQVQSPAMIYVDVEGAVCRPGVYSLPEEARIFQAVEAAGGFTADAVPQVLNQASPLSDGMQIYVPTSRELEAEQETSSGNSAAAGPPSFAQAGSGVFGEQTGSTGLEAQTETGLVNINTADSAVLETLNGIGPARARAIIDYRETVSAFGCIEDIKKVSGIGDGIFSRIRDHITV